MPATWLPAPPASPDRPPGAAHPGSSGERAAGFTRRGFPALCAAIQHDAHSAPEPQPRETRPACPAIRQLPAHRPPPLTLVDAGQAGQAPLKHTGTRPRPGHRLRVARAGGHGTPREGRPVSPPAASWLTIAGRHNLAAWQVPAGCTPGACTRAAGGRGQGRCRSGSRRCGADQAPASALRGGTGQGLMPIPP